MDLCFNGRSLARQASRVLGTHSYLRGVRNGRDPKPLPHGGAHRTATTALRRGQLSHHALMPPGSRDAARGGYDESVAMREGSTIFIGRVLARVWSRQRLLAWWAVREVRPAARGTALRALNRARTRPMRTQSPRRRQPPRARPPRRPPAASPTRPCCRPPWCHRERPGSGWRPWRRTMRC